MRKLIFLVILFALAFGASWMADHAGEFSLNWLGWQIEGSVAFLLIALFIASAFIWLLLHWLNALLHLPSEIRKERERLMSDKGLQQITHAMIAASESDEKAAKKHLDKAKNLLPDSPLPRLLQLQLAGKQQDSTLAHQQFVQLQRFTPTKPLALRGLAEQARIDGKMDEALIHVEALLKEAPHQASTQKLAIDLFSYHRRWQEAIKILKQAYGQRHINADEYKRAQATIALQQALHMLEEKNRQSAMEMLKKATSIDPSLQPAVKPYAELLKQVGKTNQAIKLVRKAWKYQPHPELAQLHASLYPNDLSEEKKARKMQDLAKQNPQAIESSILLAQAAILTEKWDEAKNHLKVGLSKQQTVTLCKLMAALYKQGYHDEAEERRWLENAVTAIEDPSWVCDSCGAKPKKWRAHCKECYDFASIQWRPNQPVVAG